MYEIYLTQEKENEAMSRELVFDYSKTAGFIREEEIVNMKKAVLGAKEVLTEKTASSCSFRFRLSFFFIEFLLISCILLLHSDFIYYLYLVYTRICQYCINTL